jgi:LacI family transcriptional regulator
VPAPTIGERRLAGRQAGLRRHATRAHVTIRDVARRAGVSIQTVSNVLNARPGVASDTRRRVQEAAATLGYSPSAAARSLRTGRGRSLGYVVRDIANPYYAEVARGVEDAARPRGYTLVLGSSGNEIGRIRELFDAFRELRVAGIVASTNPVTPAYAELVAEIAAAVPFIQLGAAAASAPVSSVAIDEARGGFVATKHLLALGRRRVAIITGPLDSYAGGRRYEGYRAALAEAGQCPDPAMVAEGRWDYESGYAGVDSLLAAGRRPDGLFAANDLVAVGAIARLRERRIRIPDDVAVIGYDGSAVGRLYDPPISTIVQPTYQLGRRGVELLFEELDADGAEPQPRRVLLDCRLIVRRSSSGSDEEVDCGPISAAESWVADVSAAGSGRGRSFHP